MRNSVRRSAYALLAAWCATAAFAAWQPAALHHLARLARPRLADVSSAPELARDPKANAAVVVRPSVASRCEVNNCVEAPPIDLAEFCPVCRDTADQSLPAVDRSGLEGLSASLAGAGSVGFAPDFDDGSNPAYLVSFEPSAVAAPTPEISTAAMVTFGFAGVVWAARRVRRPAPKPSHAPAPC